MQNDGPMRELCRQLLQAIGEDPDREGLRETPARYVRAFEELTRGYHESLDDIVHEAIFTERYSEMVLVRDIEFYSLCEHHILPFFGKAHVAYVPDGKIIGLSKIPRIVRMYARRLQVQERLTEQVADGLKELLNPMGVACYIEASHLCMMMRGVQSQSSVMVTNAMRGVFLKNEATRNEFMTMIGASR
ncbi:MAG: GTP cyclohydrolase I FolE [Bdellovibrionales bacterium]|nr:GTP cyclohydrolase I FolE [Bdellovibrionales bacterium]